MTQQVCFLVTSISHMIRNIRALVQRYASRGFEERRLGVRTPHVVVRGWMAAPQPLTTLPAAASLCPPRSAIPPLYHRVTVSPEMDWGTSALICKLIELDVRGRRLDQAGTFLGQKAKPNPRFRAACFSCTLRHCYVILLSVDPTQRGQSSIFFGGFLVACGQAGH